MEEVEVAVEVAPLARGGIAEIPRGGGEEPKSTNQETKRHVLDTIVIISEEPALRLSVPPLVQVHMFKYNVQDSRASTISTALCVIPLDDFQSIIGN